MTTTLSFDEAIRLYQTVGDRNPWVFEWFYDIFRRYPHLPCIDRKYLGTLALTKAKLSILDALVDDVADNINFRNKKLLDRLTIIPWESPKYVYNDPYYRVCKTLWLDSLDSVMKYPRFREFEELFYFDLKQVMNSMEYGWLVNTYPYADDLVNNDVYGHHAMMVVLHGMMDLMCSPKFNAEEVGKARGVLYLTQKIARIGNMISTYPRELIERDLTSPIITYALERSIISVYEFQNGKPEELEAKLKPLEKRFNELVELDLKKVLGYQNEIKSFNIKELVGNIRKVHEAYITRARYWKNKS